MSNISALAQKVNAVAAFEADLHNLLEVMGKSEVTVMPVGSAVEIYKEAVPATVTYVEGQEIPNSAVTPVLDHTAVLVWKPLRSLALYKDIQTMGFDVAVGGSVDKLKKMAGADVRKGLCDAIKSGTTTKKSDNNTALAGATVQAAAAVASARLAEMTADEGATPIFFMSPMTAAGYLGAANITTQEAFGINYLKGFLGIGTAILLPGLVDNKVYCTAEENIMLCAANVGNVSEKAQATADGVIAISIEDAPAKAGYDCCAFDGIHAFLRVLDRCCIANVGA